MIFKFSFFTFLLCLVSCTIKYDGNAPDGYPFVDDEQQLTLTFASSFNTSKLHYVSRGHLFQSKLECDTILNKIDSNCNCDEIDFTKFNLLRAYKASGQVYSGDYTPIMSINHKEKYMDFSLRFKYETGSSGMNSNYTNVVFDKWIITPKLPAGYTFIYYPAI